PALPAIRASSSRAISAFDGMAQAAGWADSCAGAGVGSVTSTASIASQPNHRAMYYPARDADLLRRDRGRREEAYAQAFRQPAGSTKSEDDADDQLAGGEEALARRYQMRTL